MRRIIAWTLSVMLAMTLVCDMGFANESKVITEDNVNESAAVDKTVDSTTYKLSNGADMTVFHSEEVRFENENGVLEDYNPALKAVTDDKSQGGNDLKDYAYENTAGDSMQYMPQSLNEEVPVLMEKDGRRVEISLTDDSLRLMMQM